MFSRRYTIIVADRTSGVVRRATISIRPLVLTICGVMTLPVLVGMGAAWKAKSEVAAFHAIRATLELENANYRAATSALAGQIESLQTALSDMGAQSALDPGVARAMDKLPSLVKARAMGGGTEVQRSAQTTLSLMTSPEDAFGLVRTLLTAIESGLNSMKLTVERRNALAAATPSIWPAHGWLSSRAGARKDPVTGEPEFHSGLDIAGEKGQAVYATAAGRISSAGYQGAYGKLIVIDHDFGLETRYGHLLDFKVKVGDHVKRGDMIGRVGATGRATGYHLHYEVLANGKLLNPLQLLTAVPRGAN
jgi:murein DD-endopeptidase MepM/ murein hydrolase activator NlpD